MLKLHCDNPACEVEVEVETEADAAIPAGWLQLEEVIEEPAHGDAEPQRVWCRIAIVCGRPCAAEYVRIEEPERGDL